MSLTDWLVLVITLLSIVLYGVWKSRNTKNIDGYLLADKQLPWYQVGLSVMATQASAITFLSAPGQAYSDGLRFIQFYFGLPIAMVVLCITFIPIFKRLNVYTAYEYLEKRFDVKTRTFTALLFLLQRGISTGITIYAPSLVLSTILHIPITYTTLFIGSIVILYTVYGGTKAVSYTQMFQMLVIFGGLFVAACMVVKMLPPSVGFLDALHIAGKMDRLNAIDLQFDWDNRYNVWSGLIGGFFLQLSYFGTDQSQVGRYLTGKSIAQSRLGLVMNGLIKIPMQFFILLIGILVFAFYQYHTPPVFFNTAETARLEQSQYQAAYRQLDQQHQQIQKQKQVYVNDLVEAVNRQNQQQAEEARLHLKKAEQDASQVRNTVKELIKKNDPNASADEADDSNYIFLNFITTYFPKGLTGLLIAIIFLASMGSVASGINSLASTSVIDFYKRFVNKQGSESRYLFASRWATVCWGIFCIITALYASKLGNLIEAVNILGSLFYGTILGIFIVAFYLKGVKGKAVFYGALLAEILVIVAWQINLTAFLWLNVLGCLLVVGIAALLQKVLPGEEGEASP